MGDSRVETISRLAQWKIENFSSYSTKKSDPFKLGIWNWHILVERNRYIYIRLYPEPSKVSKEQPPMARFILKITSNGTPRRAPYVSPVHERVLRTSEDFMWPIEWPFYDRFTIHIEFLDIKIHQSNGQEPLSIWPSDSTMQNISTKSTLRCLGRMLEESIHADVTIKTTDGELFAHKAILAGCSPVFMSMFKHEVKEKTSSEIHIDDMSTGSCMALLSYLYGTIKQEDLWNHRLALLGAANKYDIGDLKDACEDSLMEDINTENVLERLQEAWLYQLEKLKRGCFSYLFDFGKIFEVRDEMSEFFKRADRELVHLMFQEALSVWK